MTREEAINQLQDARDGYKEYLTDEALNMAIEALEQEPILNKIKAEVEIWHKDDTNWSDIRLMSIENILDKYKTESEVDNGNDDN